MNEGEVLRGEEEGEGEGVAEGEAVSKVEERDEVALRGERDDEYVLVLALVLVLGWIGSRHLVCL